MKVEFQLRWLLLLISIVVLFVLREHKVLLVIWPIAAIVTVVGWLTVMPRLARRAERNFSRESLRLLAQGQYAQVETLAKRQWLIRQFGRPHVLPETRALALGAAGESERARRLLLDALDCAPPEERARVELNLANAEALTGHTDAAEARFRMVMARRPDLAPAQLGLARLLIQRGDGLAEAATLVEENGQRWTKAVQVELWSGLADAAERFGHPDSDRYRARAAAIT